MDDVTRTALTNGHFECIDHQFGAQVVRHGPADDLAAPGIEDHGKIKKPTCRRYEGDVGDPELVRSHCHKIAIDQIRRRPRLLVPPRRCHAGTATTGTDQASHTHQPRDPLAAMLLPISPQLRMHAWRSIRGARGGMDGPDPLQQRRVRDRMGGRRSMSPSMVTGLRYAEHARHCGDREDGLIRAHELEDPGGTAPVSRANQAAARERMSRSTRSCLFSRRSRTNSSRSAAPRVSLFSSRRPLWRSTCATQLRIDCDVGSNSRASSLDRGQRAPDRPFDDGTQGNKADGFWASHEPPVKAWTAPPRRVNFREPAPAHAGLHLACASAPSP